MVVERIRSPAGLDIGAKTPAEIAVSVLAELVAERESLDRGRSAGAESAHSAHESVQPEAAEGEAVVDPVCSMTVHPETAASVDHEGETYYFCCEGCASAFLERPGNTSARRERLLRSGDRS